MFGIEINTDLDSYNYWLPPVVVFGGNFLFFFYCQFKKDNSYIDVLWGLTFVFPIAALLIVKLVNGEPTFARQWIMLALVTIWGARLALHIGVRHNGEDFRYQDMRKRWSVNGQCSFYTQAFVYVFMLQALFSVITNSAALFAVIFTPDNTLVWSDYVGIAVWITGFIIEVLGD